MSVIVLLAVGSDYNLLLVSRMKEEVGAGINTGIIRAMGGTGKVVTTAGLVFAFTMLSMVVSDLRIIGQVGSTIGARSVVRHPGGTCIHDAGHRRAARAVVLVAAEGAATAGQCGSGPSDNPRRSTGQAGGLISCCGRPGQFMGEIGAGPITVGMVGSNGREEF